MIIEPVEIHERVLAHVAARFTKLGKPHPLSQHELVFAIHQSGELIVPLHGTDSLMDSSQAWSYFGPDSMTSLTRPRPTLADI